MFNESHEKPEVNIGLVSATPLLTPEQFEAMTSGSEAIILIAYATGTTPERLNSAIKTKVDSGIPVFLLSSNSADDHGILKTTYDVQAKSAQAGAIA